MPIDLYDIENTQILSDNFLFSSREEGEKMLLEDVLFNGLILAVKYKDDNKDNGFNF
ncbi:MAG: hypothetical protein HeimC3_03090 [Candidatus Heimdallarchaeota archaeon LC_3]|nr:MAG: hypothetical protein HeimC3_03090 [Candidatus Heimdallarchaeota archaeon LC_3]